MNDAIITAILFGIPTLLSLILLFMLLNLRKRIDILTKGVKEKDLVDVVSQHIYTVNKCNREIDAINKEFEKMRSDIAKYFRKVSLLRYQGFKDTGGDHSFTLTMLDENNSGIIITSLQGRDVSKLFAKRIENGKTEHTLTDEEKQSLHDAMKS